ncbi:MAG: hypothetical protein B7Y40_04445 [Gammaproteobacteria bacterium 28-57-27]|nr:MAG: hypothetical protein B7Y40_04445 [Gammaproteobacteria bacterium 28-57-27]
MGCLTLACCLMRLFNQHADIRAKWRLRVRYLLVDEVQDTNAAQHALLRHLLDVSPHLPPWATITSRCRLARRATRKAQAFERGGSHAQTDQAGAKRLNQTRSHAQRVKS